MTVPEIMTELEALGEPNYKRIFQNHGAPEPLFGVKVAYLNKIEKRVKKNHELATGLYATGNSDAMYLAGLIADERQMTPELLQQWVEGAKWHMHCEFTVAWVAAETPYARELALNWMENPDENIAVAGWATYAHFLGITPDEKLDLEEVRDLLDVARNEVHSAPNYVRYVMNGFVIAAGVFVAPISEKARQVGVEIGKVKVKMGDTSCKVPYPPDYIDKVIARRTLGKKKKTARC